MTEGEALLLAVVVSFYIVVGLFACYKQYDDAEYERLREERRLEMEKELEEMKWR